MRSTQQFLMLTAAAAAAQNLCPPVTTRNLSVTVQPSTCMAVDPSQRVLTCTARHSHTAAAQHYAGLRISQLACPGSLEQGRHSPGQQMSSRPSTVDEAIKYVWDLPDSVLKPSDKQSIVATLADKTDGVARRYFSGPTSEMWLGTLRQLLKTSGGGKSSPAIIQALRKELQLTRSALTANFPVKSIAFSDISGTEADKLLQEVHLTEVDGFEAAPLTQTAGACDIESFDFSQYVHEDTGTPDFVKYHEKQLQIGDTAYSGGVDGGVVPYSVLAESAALLLRVGFVHKQSTADTAAFRRNNPHLRQAEVAESNEYTFQEGRGQAICCLLAAHAKCQLPLDLDLTDGKHHHLLRLRGNRLLVYQGCTPTQAYGELANFLKTQSALLTSRRILTDPPEELAEDLRAPIKKLKGLCQGGAFSEQAETLISCCDSVEEKVATAYQLARAWEFPVLDCVSKFYGT